MTEESVDNFKKALNAAEAVYRDTGASDSDIQKAITDLKTAQNGLVEAKGMDSMMIIIIAGAAIVVIIIVVIIIIAVSSSRKKKNAIKTATGHPVSGKNGMGNGPTPGMPGGTPGGPHPGGPNNGWNPQQPQGGFQPNPPFGNPASYNAGSDGSAETSVLNDGAGETTLLSGGANLPAAYLMRKKNSERITISKQVFKIGKERRRVDYCISDNSNVSRSHADVVYKNGAFYIVDNTATNGTTVNGTTVGGGQERKLMNGDVIRLADEEFKFQQN